MKLYRNTSLSLAMASAVLLMSGCDTQKPEETVAPAEQVQAPATPEVKAPVAPVAKPAFAIYSSETGMINILRKPESAPADLSIENSCPVGSLPFGLADIDFGGKLYCNDIDDRIVRVIDLASKTELFAWPWPSDIQGAPVWTIGRWKQGADVGLTAYDSAKGIFHVFDSAEKSFALRGSFEYGGVGSNLVPLVGDWDGDGADSVGVYKFASLQMDLRNTLDAGIADISFRFADKSAEPQDFAVSVNTEQGTMAALYSDSKGAVTVGSSDLALRPQSVFLFGAPEQKKTVVPIR